MVSSEHAFPKLNLCTLADINNNNIILKILRHNYLYIKLLIFIIGSKLEEWRKIAEILTEHGKLI